MDKTENSITTLVAGELARPVAQEIATLAEAAAAAHGGLGPVRAVLAYGSTLRGVALDDTLADLYVLTDDLSAVSESPLARLGCRLVPPNVHYLEITHGGHTLRAKYAVLPLSQFARRMSGDVSNPYFWARFSQPCRMVRAADDAARGEVTEAITHALRAMLNAGLSTAPQGAGWRGIWIAALENTYASELRPESTARAAGIVSRNEKWCKGTAALLLGENFTITADTPRPRINWPLVRITGKGWSLLRLAKAAFTFSGGAEYIAWKIERHSGQPVELKDWHKRHPLLAALVLLPKLLRSGAVR